MAGETSKGVTLYWCAACEKIHNESEVVFYVDLGRMCLIQRSGRVQPLDQARRLGVAPLSG